MKKSFLLFFIYLLLGACSGSKELDQGDVVLIDPAFSEYIAAFTGGVIDSDASIKLQLNTSFSEEERKRLNVKKIFKLYPTASGEAKWLDDRTIEFVPSNELKAGIRYKVQVNLASFLEVQKGLELFEFNFRTLVKTYKVELERFESYSETDFTKQKLIGQINFTGKVDSAGVSKMITVNQDGKALKVQTSRINKNTYGFVVQSIERKNSRSSLVLSWDGKAVGINKKGDKTIKIPTKDEFVVLDVEIVHSPQQYVKIHFSDPLSTEQFLDGLIYLDGHEVTMVADKQVVILYPTERIVGEDFVKIQSSIQNSKGRKLSSSTSQSVYFDDIAPDFELLGEGNIVPKTGESHFPFKAINLVAVDISITKIYEDNIVQFLQVNNFDGTYQLRRVAKEVLNQRVELNPEGDLDLHQWNNFSIDLSKYVEMDLGAIYHIEIKAKKDYSLYECTKAVGDQNLMAFSFANSDEEWNERDWEDSYYYYDYYDYDYDYDYDYTERYDPCKDSYYARKSIERNVLISDIGIIAKAGADKKIHVFLTDINTTEPLSGATVKFYDYQNQVLGEATSDAKGMIEQTLDRKPFVLVASHKGQKGYLKLRDGESLSLSKFDVSGETVQHGVKGFIYTERGVWRPGDSLYISFMLADKEDILPKSHPVKFELYNPKGVVVYEKMSTHSLNGLYNFRTRTNAEDITGNYSAKVTVGNRTFYKAIKVEAVKPNRLKIELEFDNDILSQTADRNVKMNVKWLHGAVANKLKTKVDVHLASTQTKFKKYTDFIFDDPLKEFSAEDKTIFEGTLNEDGALSFDHGISLSNNAPGMLKAYFTTKVFEQGGDFSIDRTSVVYSPYSRYAGIRVPEGDMYGGTLETDKDHLIDIVTLDEKGSPVSSSVSVNVYKLEWRWWWDNYDNNLSSYISRSSTVPIASSNVNTSGGKAHYKFRVNQPEWGRYLILTKDNNSGHTTGKIVYVDWPYYQRANRRDSENATMLSFSTDKEKYKKGETVTLSIPSPAVGKALISLESGTKIIDKFWVDTEKGETICKFVATEEMNPNVFIHVTLIQPYKKSTNDLPIRMYGVVPIYVEDPATHLSPVIEMADVLRPETKTTIKVKEKSGKPMTYTLAIVDEGLLDLTNFKTPDPWRNFNKREALGVKSWDMYDYVLGAYGEQLDKILAIGGDEDGSGKKAAKANRFEPMVRFLGPFESNGKTNSHAINIPNYVGSVRVMVIAGQDNAYGSSEKTVPVRNPLMVLGTLPRVVGPGETVTLPVNVFAMEQQIKNVSVTVKTNNLFTINGKSTQSINFNKIGDKVVNFELQVAKQTGIGKVSIVATSGSQKATYDFEIDVRTPNTEQTITVEKVLNKGETFQEALQYFGIAGTNRAFLEVSNFPPLDLGRRLDFLITYPHGCLEQVTSGVFPQLYLSELVTLEPVKIAAIQTNVNAGLDHLPLYQTASGGFAYWPGNSYDNEWATNYAGHFMLEAEKKGYTVSAAVKSKWLKFQKNQSKAWSKANATTDRGRYDDITQAYRLFTLALAGKAELSLMNRMRERDDLSIPAKWRLAAAYQLAGQKDAALSLIQGVTKEIPAYTELSYTYGSNIRDEAMILETLVLLGMKIEGAELAKRIANNLNDTQWMSTQTTAYSLLAVSKFIGNNKAEENLKFSFVIDEQKGERDSKMRMVNFELSGKNKNVRVSNSGNGILYVRLITKGVPLAGVEESSAKNINLSVAYFDMKNRPIDVKSIPQGTDFMAEITVSNNGVRGDLQEIALTHIVPSGWEIHNTRMDQYNSNKSSYFTYQDIRDDRLYTYFDLKSNEKKTFRIQLNASYLGKFYLPGIIVEAMYDNSISARIKGEWVTVKIN